MQFAQTTRAGVAITSFAMSLALMGLPAALSIAAVNPSDRVSQSPHMGFDERPKYRSETGELVVHRRDPGATAVLIFVHGGGSMDESSLESNLLVAKTEERWEPLLEAMSNDGRAGDFEIWRYVYDTTHLTLTECYERLGQFIEWSTTERGRLLGALSDRAYTHPDHRVNSASDYPALDGRPIVLVGHSYGGVVARAFMYQYRFTTNASSDLIGGLGGDIVLGLVTLASPHLGTPLTNLLIEADSRKHVYLASAIVKHPFAGFPRPNIPGAHAVTKAWEEGDYRALVDFVELYASSVESDRGLTELQWDSVHGGTAVPRLPGMGGLDERNSDALTDLNSKHKGAFDAYAQRMYLYYGTITPPVRETLSLGLLRLAYQGVGGLLGAGMSRADQDSWLDTTYHIMDAVTPARFGENDGLVPAQSATLAGLSLPIPAAHVRHFVGYNHREMVEGKDNRTLLFDTISADLAEIITPRVMFLSPSVGSTTGPTTVTVSGFGFGATPGSVTFGSIQGSVTGWSDQEIICEAPAQAGATATVTVGTRDGRQLIASQRLAYPLASPVPSVSWAASSAVGADELNIPDGETEEITFVVKNNSDRGDVFGTLAIHVGADLYLKRWESDTTDMDLRRTRLGDRLPHRNLRIVDAVDHGLQAIMTFGPQEQHTVKIQVESLHPGELHIDYRFTLDDVNHPMSSEHEDIQGWPVSRIRVHSRSGPKITRADLDPFSGTTVDNPTFHFTVSYSHDEDIPAASAVLYIDDTPHSLDLSAVDQYGDYFFDIAASDLSTGTHDHYYRVTDERGDSVTSRVYEGPVLDPPKADINIREPAGAGVVVRPGESVTIVYAASPKTVDVNWYYTSGRRLEDLDSKVLIEAGWQDPPNHGNYDGLNLRADGRYVWNTGGVPVGTYYIYAEAIGAQRTWTDFSTGPVVIRQDLIDPFIWSPTVSLSERATEDWRVTAAQDGTLVVTERVGGLYRSDDSGATWQPRVLFREVEDAQQARSSFDPAGSVHVVWRDYDDPAAVGTIAYVRRAPDGTLELPEQVISELGGHSKDPELTVDAAGVVHAVWTYFIRGEGDRHRYRRSVDSGQSWLPPQDLVVGVDSGRYHMEITTYGQSVYIVSHDRDDDAVYLLMSHDSGATWSGRIRVDRQEQQPLLPGVAVSASGLHIVYVTGESVMYQRSPSLTTWSPEVYQQVSVVTGGVSAPDIVASDDGVYVVYPTGGDVHFTWSEAGDTWSLPTPIMADATTDPSDPRIIVDAMGNLHAVAERHGFYTTTVNVGPPVNRAPQITVNTPSSAIDLSSSAPYTIRWTATDPDGDVVSVDLYRDDDLDPTDEIAIEAGIHASTYDLPVGDWPNGTHYIHLVVRDALDATGEAHSAAITLDITRPVTIDIQEPSSDYASVTSTTILWRIGEIPTGDGIQVDLFYDDDTDPAVRTPIQSLSGEAATSGVYEWDLSGMPDGDYHVAVVATVGGQASAPAYSTGKVSVNPFTFIQPDGNDDRAAAFYDITWEHRPATARVDLYYDDDTVPDELREIALAQNASGQFRWDTSAVVPGDYYIYAVAAGSVGGSAYLRDVYSAHPVSVVDTLLAIDGVTEDSNGRVLGPDAVLVVTVMTTGPVDEVTSPTFDVGNLFARPLTVSSTDDVTGISTWTGTATIADGDLAKGLPARAVFAVGSTVLTETTDTDVNIDGVVEAFGFSLEPAGAVSPGAEVTIEITAETGATATFSIEGMVDGRVMAFDANSATEGYDVLVGRYLVQDTDAADGAAVSVTIKDPAGNETTQTADSAITIVSEPEAILVHLHEGINLIHVPVKDAALERASDLFAALGGADDVSLLVLMNDAGKFVAFTPATPPGSPADLALADWSGVIAIMKRATIAEFRGGLLDTVVPLRSGLNVIGIPRSGVVGRVSDVVDMSPHIRVVVREEEGQFRAYPPSDAPLHAGQGLIIPASQPTELTFEGAGWGGSVPATPRTPVPHLDGASPVLVFEGSVRPESGGLGIPGTVVTLTHAKTGETASAIVTANTKGSFVATFVRMFGEPYRAGDLFKIDVRDPKRQFGGVSPLRQELTLQDARHGLVSVGDILMTRIPAQTTLLPNYPNPFNPDTWIPFAISQDTDVRIAVYDVKGSLVRTLDLGWLPAGTYASPTKAGHWDGTNDRGEAVASGAYWYRVRAGSFFETRRMIVLK